MNTQEINVEKKMTAIDAALAAAQARKAAKEGRTAIESSSTPKIIVTDEAKAVAAEARRLRQEQLKVERAARVAAKKSDKPAHMKKIDRAASKLPELGAASQRLFDEVTTNLSVVQIAALSLHLQHFNRVKATERALDQKVEVGQEVRIVSGDPKYIGMTGTVDRAQRIRCFVTIPGFSKPVYLFTSDVEVMSPAVAATGTEG